MTNANNQTEQNRQYDKC